jgi:hypothetical protein
MKTTSLVFLMITAMCLTASAQDHESFTQSIACNPVFLPFGTATVEYEHAVVTPHFTAGLSAWYEYANVKARWAYVKCMYSPGSSTLTGFSCGPTVGYLVGYRKDNQPEKRPNESTLTAGAMVQYNWRAGAEGNILIGIGAGAHVALKKIDDASPLARVDGDVRLVAGILF